MLKLPLADPQFKKIVVRFAIHDSGDLHMVLVITASSRAATITTALHGSQPVQVVVFAQ